MSRVNLLRTRTFCTLAVAGVMVLPSIGWAQVTAANAKAIKQAVKLDELATLKTAKQLVEAANRDYKGHRAKAAHAIQKAITEVEHHGPKVVANKQAAAAAKANAKATKAQAAKAPAVHEAQAASDAQLRAAEELLVKALAELNAGKHPKASAHVQLALKELQIALAIN